MSDITMASITDLCREVARTNDALRAIADEVRGAQRAAVRRRKRALRARASKAAAARQALRAAIAAAPELFARPRTRTLEGIRVGYRKLPGRIACDEPRAIARIRERMPDRADELVRTRESLDRAALRRLDAVELAAIGVELVAVDDEIVLGASGDDLDRMVDALLADGEETQK